MMNESFFVFPTLFAQKEQKEEKKLSFFMGTMTL